MAILGEINADQDLLYEVDETGAQQLVRSLESTQHVYVRFTNITSRPVNVWWRNFSGYRSFYALLKPKEFCDINSYVTHPWEFTDEATGERYNIGGNVIFRSPASQARVRRNYNICVNLRSLRDSALLLVALSMLNPEQVYLLDLPRHLAEDLEKLVHVIQEPKEPNIRDES